MAFSSSMEQHLARFCPLFLALFFFSLLYFARIDLSMSQFLFPSDVRKLELEHCLEAVEESNAARAVPDALALTLVHYATSNITPQQTKEEVMVTANILRRRGPCNFLVFGLGFDSPLWHALNLGGLTVFLEEDSSWITQMVQAHPYLNSYHVKYTTLVSEGDRLLEYARKEREICRPVPNLTESKCELALKTLPEQIYNTAWDVIMIDAPTGYHPGAPGRMTAIFSSAVMARAKGREKSTDIMVHDVDRPVEKSFGNEFLCSKNLIDAVGKLWHFQILGDGSSSGSKDFCTRSAD